MLKQFSRLDLRWRKVLLSSGCAFISRGISAAISILIIPIILKYLGLDKFRSWSALTSIVGIVSVLDLGLGIGFQNRVSELIGKGKKDEVGFAFRSSVCTIGLVVLVGGSILFASTYIYNISEWISCDKENAFLFSKKTILVIAVSAILIIITSLSTRLLLGLQLGWISSVTNVLNSILFYFLTIVVIRYDLGIYNLLYTYFGSQILCFVIAYYIAASRGGYDLSIIGNYSWKEGFKIFKNGSHYILPQFGAIFIYQYPFVLIATSGSVQATAVYAVLAKIGGLFLNFQQVILSQLWPSISESYHGNDLIWFHKTIIKSIRISYVFSLATILIIMPLGFVSIPILLKNQSVHVKISELILYSINIGGICILQIYTFIGNTINKTKIQTYQTVFSILFSFTFLPLLVSKYDLNGLLAGTIVSNIIVGITMNKIYVNSLLKKTPIA